MPQNSTVDYEVATQTSYNQVTQKQPGSITIVSSSSQILVVPAHSQKLSNDGNKIASKSSKRQKI